MFFLCNSSVKQSLIQQMSQQNFIVQKISSGLHCVVHACIQRLFSEIIIISYYSSNGDIIMPVDVSFQMFFFSSPVDDLYAKLCE